MLLPPPFAVQAQEITTPPDLYRLAREYYDHYQDPWELENVVTALDPARIGELSATLERYGACRGRACP